MGQTMTDQIVSEEALERLLERKRNRFILDHRLIDSPAIVWQCCPSDRLAIDASNAAVVSAMRDGGGSASEDGWWHGFKSYGNPELIFEGIASSRDSSSAKWVTELHVDGHLAAGVWTFPDYTASNGKSGVGVADFYVDAFRDFAFLSGKVYEAANYDGALWLTTTMHRSDQLPLVGPRGQILMRSSNRETLRWPLIEIKPAELPQAGRRLAEQFMRLYGRKLR